MTTSKRLVLEGQVLGVGLDPLELQPGGLRAATARVQQLGRQVARGHPRPGVRRGQRRVAGAGGDVEHPHARADAGRRDEPRAERQQERLDHGRVVARGPHGAMARLELESAAVTVILTSCLASIDADATAAGRRARRGAPPAWARHPLTWAAIPSRRAAPARRAASGRRAWPAPPRRGARRSWATGTAARAISGFESPCATSSSTSSWRAVEPGRVRARRGSRPARDAGDAGAAQPGAPAGGHGGRAEPVEQRDGVEQRLGVARTQQRDRLRRTARPARPSAARRRGRRRPARARSGAGTTGRGGRQPGAEAPQQPARRRPTRARPRARARASRASRRRPRRASPCSHAASARAQAIGLSRCSSPVARASSQASSRRSRAPGCPRRRAMRPATSSAGMRATAFASRGCATSPAAAATAASQSPIARSISARVATRYST